jgi:single-stranded DNA-binding protein
MTHFINKAIIQGRLGSNTQTQTSKKSDHKFATFSIATEVEYSTESGIKKKFTKWHEVVVI